MGYEIEIAARVTPNLVDLLSEFVDPADISSTNTMLLSVGDRAALVTVIARLNDLGLTVERVTRTC